MKPNRPKHRRIKPSHSKHGCVEPSRRRKTALPTGCWIILAVPLLLITAPFVLISEAIKEQYQRCPNCGRRGTLERIRLEPPESLALRAREEWHNARREDLRRVDPESVVWKCRVCGAGFRQDKALTRISP